MDNVEPRVLFLQLDSIQVPEARRAKANEAVVGMLMRSIERRGLLSPIRVVASLQSGTYVLSTGLHRYIAHERLGRLKVAAMVVEGDPAELELDEIEENLARKDLTVLERATAEKRQKELYLLRHPETRRGVAGGKARQGQQAKHVSFAGGKGAGRRMVEQRIQIAENLSNEVVALLAETPFANSHRQLLDLAKQPEARRLPIAQALAEGKATTVKKALLHVCRVPTNKNPVREHEARAKLEATSEGQIATAYILGRRMELFIPHDAGYVDVQDAGPGVPVPTYPDDAERVDLSSFTATLDTVLKELPMPLAWDFGLTVDVLATHVTEALLHVRDRLNGLGPDTFNIVFTWWSSDEGSPAGSIEWSYGLDPRGPRAWVNGRPTRGQLRAGFRRFLGCEVLRRTHGFSQLPALHFNRSTYVCRAEAEDSPLAEEGEGPLDEALCEKDFGDALVNMGFKRKRVLEVITSLRDQIKCNPPAAVVRMALVMLNE